MTHYVSFQGFQPTPQPAPHLSSPSCEPGSESRSLGGEGGDAPRGQLSLPAISRGGGSHPRGSSRGGPKRTPVPVPTKEDDRLDANDMQQDQPRSPSPLQPWADRQSSVGSGTPQ